MEQTEGEKANPYEKICRYKNCQQPFRARRTNQEYCCFEHKKLQDALVIKKPIRDITKRIDSILHINLKVVSDFFLTKFIKPTAKELQDAGYNDKYFTSIDLSIPGQPRIYIYCFQIKKIADNQYEITKLY